MELSGESGSLPNRSGPESFPLLSGSLLPGASGEASYSSATAEPQPDRLLLDLATHGDGPACDVLFQRHYPHLLRYANSLCSNPCDAEDICQTACFKAFHDLPLLRKPDTFCGWVMAFNRNEVRNFRKKFQKVGTPTVPLDTYLIDTMSAEPDNTSEAELKVLLGVLRHRDIAMPLACQRTAAVMLDHFAESHELPTVRRVAKATHASQGTAQRATTSVMLFWRRKLSPLGIHP